jgi:hypothetical protein
MCKGEAHGELEQQMIPVDSNLLNSALAISSFCGSKWQNFAKTGGGGGYQYECDAHYHGYAWATHPLVRKMVGCF